MTSNQHIRFDWAMERLLREKSNFHILEGFLSELLRYDVHIQDILERETNKANEADKYNRAIYKSIKTSGHDDITNCQNAQYQRGYRRKINEII